MKKSHITSGPVYYLRGSTLEAWAQARQSKWHVSKEHSSCAMSQYIRFTNNDRLNEKFFRSICSAQHLMCVDKSMNCKEFLSKILFSRNVFTYIMGVASITQ